MNGGWWVIQRLEELRKGSRRHIVHAARRSADLKVRIEELEGDVAALALLCRALEELLRKKGVVTDEEFREVCRQIDPEAGNDETRNPNDESNPKPE